MYQTVIMMAHAMIVACRFGIRVEKRSRFNYEHFSHYDFFLAAINLLLRIAHCKFLMDQPKWEPMCIAYASITF